MESSPQDSGDADEGSLESSAAVTPVDVHFGISQTYSHEDIMRYLPKKSDMDRLVANWFTTMDPMRLLLHVPTFQEDYRQFWNNQNSVSPAWLACLFAVASLGAQITGQEQRDSSALVQAEELRRLTAHAIVLADYAKPQPYMLETLLLYIKCLLLKSHDTTDKIWLMLGLVTRLATRAGYHRDPRNNPAITPYEAQMRRRVWMFVCEYDVGMCYQLGLVSVINQQKYDTQSPANLFDSDFDRDHVPASRPISEYTPMLFEITYAKLFSIFGDIIYASHDLTNPSGQETAALASRLEHKREQWPQMLKLKPLDECFMDPPELIINRFRLEFIYLKAQCVLYRRHVGLQDHADEHKRCLSAAERLIELQVSLLEASKPGAQLAGGYVHTRRHVHDFNLAAMLLCSELKKAEGQGANLTPPSDTASHPDRTRDTMLQVCALWYESDVTSPKARHALKAIERFLQHRSPPAQTDMVELNNSSYYPSLSATRDAADTVGVLGDASSFATIPFVADYELVEPSDAVDFSHLQYNGFDIEQDPLYQDLFGPTYPAPERHCPTYP